MLASDPASRMNQNFKPAGIPRDSEAVENALVWQFRLARTCPSDTACGSPIFRALTAFGLLIGTALFAGAMIYV